MAAPTTAQQFFWIDGTANDETLSGANVVNEILTTTAGGSTCACTFTSTTASSQTAVPTRGGTATTGAAGDVTSNDGYAMNVLAASPDSLQSTATAMRIFLAGQWTFGRTVTISAPAATQTISVFATFKVYRVASGGGARTLLFTATSQTATNNGLTSTNVGLTATSAAQPLITLQAGETIMVGILITSAATALLGTTTNTVITVASTGADGFTVPAPGVRTNYVQNYSASTATSAVLQRVVRLARAASPVTTAAMVKTIGLFRAASPVTTAALQRRITPTAKQATTATSSVIQKNIAQTSKQATTQSSAILGPRQIALYRSASTSTSAVVARAFVHALIAASTSSTAAFSKFANLHRNYAAPTYATGQLMLGISQAILNRITGTGGGTTTIIKKFFSVYDD